MDGSPPSAPSQGILALEGWDQPPRRQPSPAAAPVLAVDGFEGPLDWLLELARAQRIDLARLSIAALIGAFAAALEAALAGQDPVALDRWGGWVVMAATLTLLRSRLLLPPDAAEGRDAREEAEALRRRLLDRTAVAAAAAWLDGRAQLGRDLFARGRPEASIAARAGDLTELLRACLAALRLPAQADRLYRPLPPVLWQVPEAIARITALLGAMPEGSALQAFVPGVARGVPERALRCRAAVASTLVAGLELAKNNALSLRQAQPWDEIRVLRGVATSSLAT